MLRVICAGCGTAEASLSTPSKKSPVAGHALLTVSAGHALVARKSHSNHFCARRSLSLIAPPSKLIVLQ